MVDYVKQTSFTAPDDGEHIALRGAKPTVDPEKSTPLHQFKEEKM